MGCGSSTGATHVESTIMNSGTPVDLDVLIKAYAQDMWVWTENPWNSHSLGDIQFEIDWSHVKITPEEPEYFNAVNVNKDNGSPKTLKIYSSMHKNDTDLNQEYTVTDTRTTVSSAVVRVTSGMLLPHQGLELELPKTQCSKFPRRMTICQAGSIDEVREEITWTIGSRIKAKKRSKVKVTMTIKEQQFEKSFELKAVLKGKILISVFQTQNRQFLRHMEGNIAEIISYAQDRGLADDWSVEWAKGTATCIVKGNLFMRFQVEKNETATEMGLEEEDSSDEGEDGGNSTCSETESTHRRSSNATLSRRSRITSSSGVQMN